MSDDQGAAQAAGAKTGIETRGDREAPETISQPLTANGRADAAENAVRMAFATALPAETRCRQVPQAAEGV